MPGTRRRTGLRVLALAACLVAAAVAPADGAGAALPPRETGYVLVARDGGVFTFGAARFAGSSAGRTSGPVVGVAATASARGYWLAARDGGVFAFRAPFHGSAAAVRPAAPVAAIAALPSGLGYWLAEAGGAVHAFGQAPGFPPVGPVARPVVGLASTASGRGLWMVASDGGVFAFGDAGFHGSTGAMALAAPVVGMAPTPTGGGYWLVASDGGIFAFGDAAFHGSTGAKALVAPVVGMAPTPRGAGYWLAAADGGIFAFGDAPFHGSMGGTRLAAPVVAVAPAHRPPPPPAAVFYYPWYATPAVDGLWRHWDQGGHTPPEDVGADYYPLRGAYSNGDPLIVEAQVAEIAATGARQVVTSWWGRGSYEDGRLPVVVAAARRHGLTTGIILEPYPGRSPASARDDMARARSRGVSEVWVYDVLGGDPDAWAAVTAARGDLRMWAHWGDLGAVRSGAAQERARRAGFDGIFTYDPLSFVPADYAAICAHARGNGLACSPSVAPGFEARRATSNQLVRSRAGGATYDEQWAGGLEAAPDVVSVTSYNEWHEGSQIEAAAPRRCLPDGFCYADYEGAYGRTGPAAVTAYLDRTAGWIARVRSGQD